MDTIVAVETVTAEETLEQPVELVEISLSDLDRVAGGSSIGCAY